MARAAAILGGLLALCASAQADQVVLLTRSPKGELVSGMPYDDVVVMGVKDGQLEFRPKARLGPEGVLRRPLTEISTIRIEGQPSFNDGELRMEKTEKKPLRPEEAIASYDMAAKEMTNPWQQELLRFRRLRALRQVKMIDRAAEDWVKIAEDSLKAEDPNAIRTAIALRPVKEDAGAKGSQENARATSILEAKLKQIKGAREKAEYAGAVRELLWRLYEADGKAEKAAELAREIAGAADQATTAEGAGNTGVEIVAAASDRGRLQAAKALIDKGQVQAKDLEAFLRNFAANRDKYRSEDLPLALLVAGRAQLALWELGDKKDKTPLVDAGLNLMRVRAHFPDSKEAAEALFYAGQVNQALGNRSGATAAYEAIKRYYDKSEVAAKAIAAIEAMKTRKANP